MIKVYLWKDGSNDPIKYTLQEFAQRFNCGILPSGELEIQFVVE